MPKVLITGATGLLGRAFHKSFKAAGWSVIGTGLSRANGKDIVKLHLLDQNAVKTLIENERPDIIIHSAADRSPDSVAANPDRARALNVDATSHLVESSSSLGIPLVYISTDYVFPGVPGEAPYLESATPRATNLYGQLKLDGEKAVLASPLNQNGSPLAVVLRVPVLYGHVDPAVGNKESAINVLVDKVREAAEGKKATMDDWAKRYPTNVEDVAEAMVILGKKWLEAIGESEKGSQQIPKMLHFSGKECLTKYEICQTLAGILGVDIGTMERDSAGGAGSAGGQRPYDTKLATGELERVLGGELKTDGFRDWWTQELKA